MHFQATALLIKPHFCYSSIRWHQHQYNLSSLTLLWFQHMHSDHANWQIWMGRMSFVILPGERRQCCLYSPPHTDWEEKCSSSQTEILPSQDIKGDVCLKSYKICFSLLHQQRKEKKQGSLKEYASLQPLATMIQPILVKHWESLQIIVSNMMKRHHLATPTPPLLGFILNPVYLVWTCLQKFGVQKTVILYL